MSEHLQTIGMKKNYRTLMRSCEITGSSEFAVLQENGRIGEPGVYGRNSVCISKTCGYKMANPRYEDQFYKDYYEELYRAVTLGSVKPSADYIAHQKERGLRVLGYVSRFVKTPGRMLDLGCASGATMIAWMGAGWKCRGVDPHKASVDTAVHDLGLDVHVGVGEDLPFDDNSFDLFLCLGPHEHAYDLNKMFEETRRTLVDGGWLLIRWRSHKIFGSPLEYFNHNHYRFFTWSTWKLVLRKQGFSIVDTTSEKLEGSQSYEYILARKDLEPSDAAVRQMIDSGVKDDWQQEIDNLQAVRDGYYERCRSFLDLGVRCKGDEQAIESAIRNGEVHWTFLANKAEWRVPRSILEAERYVAEYEAGRAC